MPVSLSSRRRSVGSLTARRSPSPGPALATSLLGFFVITLDALIVHVALPSIRADLGGGITGLQWVVDGYTLLFAALLLSAGALSDRIGARQAYAVGIALFIVASAACGLAPSLGALVAARLAQGAGAAVMMPATLSLIREAYPDPVKRARAISLWAVGGAVASAAGPLAGGALSLISWRMIFFINLPVGLVALFILTRVARSPQRAVPFDWMGQVTSILAMGALTYGAIEAGTLGFAAPEVLIALAVAAVALFAFVLAQARGKHPMVPLDLFQSRTVVISVSVGFALTAGFFGMVFLLSLYVQEDRGLTPLEAGLLFVPMTLLTGFVNSSAARVAERLGPRVPVAVGQLLMVVGLASLCFVSSATPTWTMAVLMIPVATGIALAAPPLTALLLDSVPAERTGMASGLLNTCRQLGGALAIAVFGALLAHAPTFVDGMRAGLLISAALLLATGTASLLLRGRTTRRG
ncbi:MFS transporter [Streptomyces sp. NPDC050315]|uniref:MFS transporter n=1 Tax=Streptomyces sp. NPDC050315 TaxID=3155039 RepID=UPI0034188DB5